MTTIRFGRSRRWTGIAAAAAIGVVAGSVSLAGAMGGQAGSGDATSFVPIESCRLLDTRPATQVGDFSTPMQASEIRAIAAHGVSGDCDISSDVVAVSLNVTAVGATAPTFLTLYPSDTTRPGSSNMNPGPDALITANAVTTAISTTGDFTVYNAAGSVDVIVDLFGVYVPADATIATQGPAGPAGMDGAAGPAGADGEDGADGAQGPAGPEKELFFRDTDGDGYGSDGANRPFNDLVLAVTAPPGYVDNALDCDDSNEDINPDGTEVLGNFFDENCDGVLAVMYYPDADDDFVTISVGAKIGDVRRLEPGYNSYLSDPEDCDDNDPNISPYAYDTPADGIDQDCDGTDNTGQTLYADKDYDLFTSSTDTVLGDPSNPPGGYSEFQSQDDDCDDNDPNIHPGAAEFPGDAIDSNCDGFDDT